ncbi:MAG: PilZ domain-containing protein [Desulfovibrio sp.]
MSKKENEHTVVRESGVKLDIEIGMRAMLQFAFTPIKKQAEVLGRDGYDFIIFKVRLSQSDLEKLYYTNGIIVQMIRDGVVYGFRTEAITAHASPTTMVYVRWPDIVEQLKLRKNQRYECRVAGGIHSNYGDFECRVIDLNEDGCKMTVRTKASDPIRKMKPGDDFVISVHFSNDNIISVPFAVRSISMKSGIMTVGGAFVGLANEDKKRINTFIEEFLAEH